MGIKNYDILGLDIDGNPVEEFMILRAPFSDCIEDWSTVPDIDPRLYTLVRASNGKTYLISVYDDWSKEEIINYENFKNESTSFLELLEPKNEVHTIVLKCGESRNYEIAYDSDGMFWYYERNKEELKQELDSILKDKNKSPILLDNKIKLYNGNIIKHDIREGYCTDVITIREGYLKDDDLIKDICFAIWDDMSFSAYVKGEDETIKKVEFEFDINHPLYFCIKRLLGNDDEFIIDDDHTSEKNKCYLIIKKEDYKFKFKFVNELKENKYSFGKFNVFIKNIGPDCRSKMDFSVKKRLIDFFREVNEVLKEDYIQMTFEESKEIDDYIKKKKRGK